MTSRFVSIALALVLLVTQQLGLQHLLAHGLPGAAGPLAASASAAPHPAHAHALELEAAAADGLCQACLSLVVLGTATLATAPCWVEPTARHAAPPSPTLTPWPCRTAAGYHARAPPFRT